MLLDSVVQESLIAAADGKSYRIKFYNLDMIISVGYRIKSHVAARCIKQLDLSKIGEAPI